jgi:hypothetical protein
MSDSSPTDTVAEAFEAQRDRLRAVAYRMLGSHAHAEDVVQAFLAAARRGDFEELLRVLACPGARTVARSWSSRSPSSTAGSPPSRP